MIWSIKRCILLVFGLTLFMQMSAQEVKLNKCKASYYSNYFHGRTTSNGEIFDQAKLTAAHKTLPFGSLVKVTNINTLKSVIVRINDRGPFYKKRCIDLSKEAAREIGMLESGVNLVIMECMYIPKEKK